SLLAEFFVAKFAIRCGRRVTGISTEACQCLMNYSWPGNVRELENVIERAVVLCNTGVIRPDDLPDEIVEAESPEQTHSQPSAQFMQKNIKAGQSLQLVPSDEMTYRDALRESKRLIIQTALEKAGGDLSMAAKRLDIHVNNLYRHIRELGLKDKSKI